jgi:hypothetical protein
MNASDRSLSPLSLDPTLAAGQAHKPRKPPLAARGVLRLLERLQIGRLDFHGPDGVWRHFGQDASGPHAEVALHDWAVLGEVLKRGDIAFAEAWMRRAWDTPDLPALLKLLVANREIIARALQAACWAGCPTASAIFCAATAAPEAATTSTRITTSATPSTRFGSTRA